MLKVLSCCVAPRLPTARSAAPAAAPGTRSAWKCRGSGIERTQPTAPFCSERLWGLRVTARQLTLLLHEINLKINIFDVLEFYLGNGSTL